jgi:hypothetical protein
MDKLTSLNYGCEQQDIYLIWTGNTPISQQVVLKLHL